jgi:Phage QLRG family, putative DNA packaging.
VQRLKVSELTVQNVVEYLRLEDGEYKSDDIQTLINISKRFVSSYTGIPINATTEKPTSLDDYEDFVIVVYILCQDMHDNRSLYVDKSNLNKVVSTILGMHCVNLM